MLHLAATALMQSKAAFRAEPGRGVANPPVHPGSSGFVPSQGLLKGALKMEEDASYLPESWLRASSQHVERAGVASGWAPHHRRAGGVKGATPPSPKPKTRTSLLPPHPSLQTQVERDVTP